MAAVVETSLRLSVVHHSRTSELDFDSDAAD